ncbi:MAG: cation:proton antiporter [Acidimicrobiales bacterium]
MVLAAIVAACFVAWGLLGGRLARANISGPMAFVAAGVVVGLLPDGIVQVSVHSESLKLLAEVALAVVLFGDAAGVPLRTLEHDAGVPARLLLIGLPLTMAAGTLAAHLLLPGLSWWVCGVIGTAVSPTDAALGAAIVEDRRVPSRVRRILNVESGLNDGIATPFVTMCIVGAVAGTALEISSDGRALVDLAGGVLLGAAIGVVAGKLVGLALRHRLVDRAMLPVGIAAASLFAYFATVAIGANGFVAAFVAGLAFGASRPRLAPAADAEAEADEDDLHFAHRSGELLALTVWFLFGALATSPLRDVTWREAVFAVLALTVVRMVPVAISLVGARFDRSTVAIIGWFGPRGLASVVFGILAFDALPQSDSSRVLTAIGATVLLSVVAHGMSAAPLAARFGASHPEPAGAQPQEAGAE